jgi:hypothetical protein
MYKWPLGILSIAPFIAGCDISRELQRPASITDSELRVIVCKVEREAHSLPIRLVPELKQKLVAAMGETPRTSCHP